jgi:predicted membrane channel-forming protein YqfA (hemolysin III family)
MYLFRVHDQTCNIWTHLLPSIFYFVMMIIINNDLKFYCFTQGLCFGLSALYHTYYHDKRYKHKLLILDFAGIFIAITGVNLYVYHYVFHEYTYFIFGHMIYIMIFMYFSKKYTFQNIYVRCLMYFGMSMFNIVPVIYAQLYVNVSISLSIFLSLSSIAFYISEFPESVYINRDFSIIGNSHNIFHVLSASSSLCIFNFLVHQKKDYYYHNHQKCEHCI